MGHDARTNSWTLQKLKRETAKDLQKAIRLESADRNGECQCVTCGKRYHWKEIQAGHFVSGRSNGVLFDERGIHPQCVSCNMFRNGNQEAYFQFMLSRFGQSVIDELLANRRKVVQFSRAELNAMRSGYRDRIKKRMEDLI